MTENTDTSLPSFAVGAINLASARLGAKGLYATDEFFAPLERMLQDVPASFDPDLYDDNGKYMDGWESRRKRVPGHDWAIIRLAMPGRIFGFDVDTSYFTGNYPPHCSIEAAFVESGDPTDATAWTEILVKSPLGSSAHHFFEMLTRKRSGRIFACTSIPMAAWHVCASMARPISTGRRSVSTEEVDLAYIFNGAKSLAWSDAHYGHPDKMLGPGRGINMGDGWETKRRRGPGHDWTIIRLGHPGTIKRVIVDTAFFKGNFPDTLRTARCLSARPRRHAAPRPRSPLPKAGSRSCRARSCRWTTFTTMAAMSSPRSAR